MHQVPSLRLQLHLLGEAPWAVFPALPGGEPAGRGWRGGEGKRWEPRFVSFSDAWFWLFSPLAALPPPTPSEGERRVPGCSPLYFSRFWGLSSGGKVVLGLWIARPH